MGLIDVEILAAQKAKWEVRRQRLERMKLAPVTNSKPAAPSSTTLSSSSSSRNGRQHQTTNNYVEYMDVELHKAAASDEDDVDGFISILKRVLAEKGYSLSDIFGQVSPLGNTLLHVAASHDNVEIIWLIGPLCPSMIMKQNSNGDTALHLTAASRPIFVVRSLIQLWLQGDQVGRGAIHEQIREVTEITNDLNLLRVRNKKGNTALHEAVINGRGPAAYVLIFGDPKVSYFLNMEGESPLYLAVKAGDKEMVTCMLRNIRNKDKFLKGKSSLQAAIMRRDKGLIDIILQNEPRFINLPDKEGRTALHYAAFKGYDDELQYLLEKFSASPIERDNDGLFPIHLAVIEGHIQAVQVSLQHCPDPREMLNRNGQNILHIATIAEKYDIVSYILKNNALGILINHRDLDGNTPLHLAAVKSNAMIVSTMAQDMRVDLMIVNNEGLTVLNVMENFIERTSFNEKQLIWAALSAVKYANPRS